MKSVILLIDGGHLRVSARDAGHFMDPDFIEGLSRRITASDEELKKVLYYDCAPYQGRQRQPVSGEEKEFSADGSWLDDLACRDLFAVRRGQLKFRGWSPKKIPVAGTELSDSHFKPNFEQKGVDMRLGLDIAEISEERLADRILLVSADTDMIPAMKKARRSGIQVVLFQLPAKNSSGILRTELKANADYVRQVTF